MWRKIRWSLTLYKVFKLIEVVFKKKKNWSELVLNHWAAKVFPQDKCLWLQDAWDGVGNGYTELTQTRLRIQKLQTQLQVHQGEAEQEVSVLGDELRVQSPALWVHAQPALSPGCSQLDGTVSQLWTESMCWIGLVNVGRPFVQS